ncbi:MAG: fibronectin type III domain-containing protein [Lachnospiraceae bacterium]|nr:fibronectin type III domain-containing protein [Lachnospiraceae bacterium]
MGNTKLNLQLRFNDNGSLTATWTKYAGVAKTQVEIYDQKDKVMVEPVLKVDGNSFTTHGNLKTNRKYKVVIIALDATGRRLSDDGQEILMPSDFYTSRVPNTPENVKATVSGSTVTITFDEVQGASKYDVEFAGKITEVSINRFVQNGLILGNTYSFRVRAKNTRFTGAWSALGSV